MNHTFTQAALRMGCLGAALLAAQLVMAQVAAPTPFRPEPTEVGDDAPPPLDDITTRRVVTEHRVLAWQPVREADILWEKRLWRVIDVREKMNLPFTYPAAPLFEVFTKAALAGDLPLYSVVDDRFSQRLSAEEVRRTFLKRDTVLRYNLETEEEETVIVENQLNWEDVQRFRIKEAWWFDANTGELRVRILGIAPLLNVVDANGDFRFEQPLFWVHYPSARPLLAQQKAYLHGDNLAATTTWEDLFEMRYFASTVYKENNLYDRRLQDYLTGTDLLSEAGKIEDALFDQEHDLWSW